MGYINDIEIAERNAMEKIAWNEAAKNKRERESKQKEEGNREAKIRKEVLKELFNEFSNEFRLICNQEDKNKDPEYKHVLIGRERQASKTVNHIMSKIVELEGK